MKDRFDEEAKEIVDIWQTRTLVGNCRCIRKFQMSDIANALRETDKKARKVK